MTDVVPHYLFRRPSAKMAPAIVLGYARAAAQLSAKHFSSSPPTNAIEAAARYAPRRDRPLVYNMMFNTLDGLLAIGRQAKPLPCERALEAARSTRNQNSSLTCPYRNVWPAPGLQVD